MAVELAMKRVGERLEPVDPVSAEELSRISPKAEVLVSVRTPRNIRQHKLAWALAHKVADNVEEFRDHSQAMDWLKIASGHVRYLKDPHTQKLYVLPDSIAFASCPQEKFASIFDKMVKIICEQIIPGMEESALRHEVEMMVGMRDTPGESPASGARLQSDNSRTRDPAPRGNPGRSSSGGGI